MSVLANISVLNQSLTNANTLEEHDETQTGLIAATLSQKPFSSNFIALAFLLPAHLSGFRCSPSRHYLQPLLGGQA